MCRHPARNRTLVLQEYSTALAESGRGTGVLSSGRPAQMCARSSAKKGKPVPDNLEVIVDGGGVTGLTVAWQLSSRSPRTSLALVEASDRVGGVVGSHWQDGFTVDTGPHGFTAHGPGGVAELAGELGLDDEIVVAEKTSQKM